MPRKRLTRDRGEKIWFTIQMPVELRNAISDKALRERVNASEFFRKCAEIFVSTNSMEEALKHVKKLAASLKIKGAASVKRKHNPKPRSTKIVMPDREKLA
jgi:hypothetical protein